MSQKEKSERECEERKRQWKIGETRKNIKYIVKQRNRQRSAMNPRGRGRGGGAGGGAGGRSNF